MQELRAMTDTVNEYKRFTHFETRVLKKAIEEINRYTHLNVAYDKIKKGRSIDSIVFHITKKWQADDTSYKLDDPLYQEKNRKKRTNRTSFVYGSYVKQIHTLVARCHVVKSV